MPVLKEILKTLSQVIFVEYNIIIESSSILRANSLAVYYLNIVQSWPLQIICSNWMSVYQTQADIKYTIIIFLLKLGIKNNQNVL